MGSVCSELSVGSSVAGEEVKGRSSSKEYGIGLTFLKATDTGFPVKRVKEGGPAEKVGCVYCFFFVFFVS